MQLRISNSNNNYQPNNTITFGAKAEFCTELEQIIKNSSPTGTDFLQKMFKSFKGNVPVLFNLASNIKTRKIEIIAMNRQNGEIFPISSPATREGLNNLMGYLMHTPKNFCKKFWDI